jgi:hypothetical protein
MMFVRYGILIMSRQSTCRRGQQACLSVLHMAQVLHVYTLYGTRDHLLPLIKIMTCTRSVKVVLSHHCPAYPSAWKVLASS